ncbi:hypothetical protein AMTRI_Chr02g215100 [Amborella trichopoda]
MGGSECSSSGESGWTMYLDQPLGKPIPQTLKTGDDSLSMVSDASSGPPYTASFPISSFPKVNFKDKISLSLSFHVFL